MLPYEPPKVDFKRPKLETVLLFLSTQGWTIEKYTPRYIVVKPPEETRSVEEGGYRYYVPAVLEGGINDEAAFRMVETFAEIFDLPLQLLFDMLSKNLAEIKDYNDRFPQMLKLQEAMLEHA